MEERARRKAAEPTPEQVEEMYDRFCKLLQEKGLADEEGNPTEKTHAIARAISMEQARMAREEKEKKKRRIRKNVTKAAAVVLVAGGCLFGFCMTSEANWLRVMFSGESTRNAGVVTQIDNGENRELLDVTEEEAKADIVEKLKVQIPEFYYIPEGMSYYKYEVSEETGIAKILYKYQDGYLFFFVGDNEKDLSHGDWTNNEKVNIQTLDDNIEIEIKNLSDNEDESQFMAFWEYKNVYYTFGGRIEKEELIKILKKMQYNL
ncbi:MAG: DUF4367 domain-containing protein [Fusicatenibacter sp.]|nr:DUF4367 domain-containing protein [Fusicatenibacter sp.]